jgi:DNA polymerase-1
MKSDYSQVEYRLFAHYAVGEGSEEFREQYRQNPNIDYHQWCADEAGTDRKKAKTVNFGVIYGMGLAALADKLNVTLDEARRFMGQYNEKLPFLKTTLQAVAERASSRGYVRTILNRRRRFIAWEPSDWELSREVSALRDQDEMIEIVNEHVKRARDNKKNPPRPGIRRAHTHKALNAVIQGSAADLIKKAMVDCAEAGIFDVLPLHLTVHDELDNSIVQDKRGMEAADEMKRLMENAIPFKVPIVVDRDVLVNWGGLIRDKKPKQ